MVAPFRNWYLCSSAETSHERLQLTHPARRQRQIDHLDYREETCRQLLCDRVIFSRVHLQCTVVVLKESMLLRMDWAGLGKRQAMANRANARTLPHDFRLGSSMM